MDQALLYRLPLVIKTVVRLNSESADFSVLAPLCLTGAVQALCSYLRGVLCLTAMLDAAGVGDGEHREESRSSNFYPEIARDNYCSRRKPLAQNPYLRQ